MISLLLSLLLIIFVLPLSLSFLDRGTVTLEGAEEAMRSSDPLAGRPVTDGGWTSIGRTARFNYHNRYLSFSSPARGNRCLRVQLTRKKCPPLCGSAMAGGERKEEERKKERKGEGTSSAENRGGGEGGGKIYTLGPVHARICMPSARSMFEGAWGSSPLVHHPSNGRLH